MSIQGRTIRKVIISLSEHPSQFVKIKWEGLYVALSRVKFKDDIRLLLRNEDRSTMAYIKDLAKNKLVKSFFKGYVPIEAQVQEHDEHQCIGLMRWDSIQASKDAGFLVDGGNKTDSKK